MKPSNLRVRGFLCVPGLIVADGVDGQLAEKLCRRTNSGHSLRRRSRYPRTIGPSVTWSDREEPKLDAEGVGEVLQVVGIAGDHGGLVSDGRHDDDSVD